MNAESPSLVPSLAPATDTQRPAYLRSRVSNGADLFLAPVDARSREFRRFRDVYGDLVQHLGGEAHVSEARRHLAKRATALVVWSEVAEAKLANGEDLDIATFTTAANTLRRLLGDLGLDPTARDVTPALHHYLQGAKSE